MKKCDILAGNSKTYPGIEVKHSAGDQTDAYINAAAIDIYKAEEVVAEDKVISKPVLTAVAPVTGRHLLT